MATSRLRPSHALHRAGRSRRFWCGIWPRKWRSSDAEGLGTMLTTAPNPRLQRTRAALLLKSVLGERSSFGGNRRAPLSRQPLGDLAHRGTECGESSPSPGHRSGQSQANFAALWSWLSFHHGVGREESSWRIGWRSSGDTAPAAVRRSSSRAHSSPNPRLQRTRSASPPSPLSRQPLGDLAHRGTECGESSPSPGHRSGQSQANFAALWSWLSFHHGVGREESSWRIGWRSSGDTAPAAVRRSSSRAHSSPNPRLQRTRVRPSGGRSPLSRQPLGDLAHRGSECGERSPGPGHRDSESVANHEALWQGLSFHRGVARFASSWRIGCHSSGGTAPEAARRLSSRAHSSPNPRLQRTRSSASPPRSPLSRQPLGARSIGSAE